MEAGIIESVTQTQGNDVHIRNQLDLETRFHQEANAVLADLYAYWSGLPRKDGLPAAPAIDLTADLHEAFGGRVGWIDVSSEDPLDFIMHDVPKVSDYASINNQSLRTHPSSMNALACAKEHFVCKLSRQPVYYEIDQTIGGSMRHYFRLALPVADWNGQVSKLIFGVRMYQMRPARETPTQRANDNISPAVEPATTEIRSYYFLSDWG